MRFVSCGFASLALALAIATASDARTWDASSALETARPPAGLRLVWADTGTNPVSTLDQLERAGFHVAVSLPPHVYYVRDEGSLSALPAGCAFRDGGAANASGTPEAVMDIVTAYYPPQQIPAKAQFLVESLFEEGRV